jgi:hypothetical protein
MLAGSDHFLLPICNGPGHRRFQEADKVSDASRYSAFSASLEDVLFQFETAPAPASGESGSSPPGNGLGSGAAGFDGSPHLNARIIGSTADYPVPLLQSKGHWKVYVP